MDVLECSTAFGLPFCRSPRWSRMLKQRPGAHVARCAHRPAQMLLLPFSQAAALLAQAPSKDGERDGRAFRSKAGSSDWVKTRSFSDRRGWAKHGQAEETRFWIGCPVGEKKVRWPKFHTPNVPKKKLPQQQLRLLVSHCFADRLQERPKAKRKKGGTDALASKFPPILRARAAIRVSSSAGRGNPIRGLRQGKSRRPNTFGKIRPIRRRENPGGKRHGGLYRKTPPASPSIRRASCNSASRIQ